MNTFSFANVYAAASHFAAIAVVASLTALGVLDVAVGLPLLSGLLGLGIGVGVTPGAAGTVTSPVALPVAVTAAPVVTPAVGVRPGVTLSTPTGASIVLTPEQSNALATPPAS